MLRHPDIFEDNTYYNADEIDRMKCLPSFLASGQKIRVREDQYFVLGDKSADSLDSRFWGTLPHDNIKGKVVLRWWPVSRFHLI